MTIGNFNYIIPPKEPIIQKIGTDEFRSYVAEMTGFQEPDRRSSTNIRHLAQDICGVNPPCGYQHEHHAEELIVKDDWLYDLEVIEKWLSCPDVPRFMR